MKIMTGKPIFFAASTLFLSLLLVGCQSATRSLPDSAGSASRNSTGLEFAGQTCRTDLLYSASGGPDVLYAEMNECVRAQKFDRAVFLYASIS